jgi:hypothetical protein
MKLSAALGAMPEAANGRLTAEEPLWIQSEIRGYTITEVNDPNLPAGFVADAERAILPEYRKLTPIRAIAVRPGGQRLEVSATDLGRMPHLQVMGISAIEETILPIIENGDPPGDRVTMPNGDVVSRYLDPDSITGLMTAVRVRLVQIIDRLQAA